MTATVLSNTTGAPSQDGAPVFLPPDLASNSPRRVVFDTNVLISLFVFTDSQFAPLLGEVDAGRWIAYSSEACLAEYCRVVGYPIFGLAAERQREVTAAWQCRLVMVSASLPTEVPLPRCKDRDDQKFLELARDAKAEWLVTADKALLRLAHRDKLRGLFEIIPPVAALNRLGDQPTMDCSSSLG